MTAKAKGATGSQADRPAPEAAVDLSSTLNTATLTNQPMPSQNLGVFFNSASKSSEALLAKMTPDHLSQVIKQADSDSLRRHHERMMLMVGCAVVFPGLCWLFLHYQQSTLIVPVMTAITGFVGGIGIGRSTAGVGAKDKS